MKNSDYMNFHSVNALYKIIGEVDESFEEKNLNKYLTFASTNQKQKTVAKVHGTLG